MTRVLIRERNAEDASYVEDDGDGGDDVYGAFEKLVDGKAHDEPNDEADDGEDEYEGKERCNHMRESIAGIVGKASLEIKCLRLHATGARETIASFRF